MITAAQAGECGHTHLRTKPDRNRRMLESLIVSRKTSSGGNQMTKARIHATQPAHAHWHRANFFDPSPQDSLRLYL